MPQVSSNPTGSSKVTAFSTPPETGQVQVVKILSWFVARRGKAADNPYGEIEIALSYPQEITERDFTKVSVGEIDEVIDALQRIKAAHLSA